MNSSPSVLHVTNELDDIGNGITNTVVDLACGQAACGQKVGIASPCGSYVPLIAAWGVAHFPVDHCARLTALVRAIDRLRVVIDRFQPDVIHCHTVSSFLVAMMARTSRRVPIFGHVHNPHQRSTIVMALADRVVAVSEAVAQYLAQVRVPASRIVTVHNRVLGGARSGRERHRVPTLARPAVVTVAGLNCHKGIDVVIDAFSRLHPAHPDAHLYIVGNGVERQSYERLAAASAARGRIHFEGFRNDPAGYMEQADVFVLASRRESFGLVLIEARQAGCAIVASQVGGVPEALEHGRAGILVPPERPDILAGTISGLLADAAMRAALGARARERLDQYRVERMVQDLAAVYEDALRDDGSRPDVAKAS